MNNLNRQIIDEARRLIGTPYSRFGADLRSGLGCCGLIVAVADRLNLTTQIMDALRAPHRIPIKLPPTRPERWEAGDIVVITSGPRQIAGFGPRQPGVHLGIATGPDTWIHSHPHVSHALCRHLASRKAGVIEVPMSTYARSAIIARFPLVRRTPAVIMPSRRMPGTPEKSHLP